MRRFLIGAGIAGALLAGGVTTVFADDVTDLERALKQHYPQTKFDSIKKSTLEGLFEVVMGKNIAYTDKNGRYFLFGRVFDMETRRDITGEKLAELSKVDWKMLPLENAIKYVNGTGAREFAVFSDPDCPFCKKLEAEMPKIENATIYVFPYPIAQLHPNAEKKSVSIWCAKDRATAWRDAVAGGKEPSPAECKNPVKDNIALAERLGINGTPHLISKEGGIRPGYSPAADISAWLDSQKKVKVGAR